ncbi:hypothetical protein Enr13x_24750 [Stieleria neptunia]|uniref:Uncharacterized protein n=1 Tax=Stieleria neptunia TaxID=2527979 RepID=A0A518HP50_9BACT|nr:hypothetical protein Enr13x_24750 [Stieleria neptunia]
MPVWLRHTFSVVARREPYAVNDLFPVFVEVLAAGRKPSGSASLPTYRRARALPLTNRSRRKAGAWEQGLGYESNASAIKLAARSTCSLLVVQPSETRRVRPI